MRWCPKQNVTSGPPQPRAIPHGIPVKEDSLSTTVHKWREWGKEKGVVWWAQRTQCHWGDLHGTQNHTAPYLQVRILLPWGHASPSMTTIITDKGTILLIKILLRKTRVNKVSNLCVLPESQRTFNLFSLKHTSFSIPWNSLSSNFFPHKKLMPH